MKRWLLTILSLLLFQQGFAQVSPHPYRGTISTAGTDCSTATNCVSVTIPPETASATIAVDADTGSWSGTVQFEGSVDGVKWIAMAPTNNSSSPSSSTTSTGTWQFNPASYIQIRARGSARVSGTVGIVINWSNATASNRGSLLNPLGAANDLTCILGVKVLGPCDTGNATYSSSTLSAPNATISGTLTVGPGYATDGTTVLYKFATPSGANMVLAATGDTARTDLQLESKAGTGNFAYFLRPGDQGTCVADAIGLTAGHLFGLSGATAATCVDLGANTAAVISALTQPYYGIVLTTTAAAGNAPVLWLGARSVLAGIVPQTGAVAGYSLTASGASGGVATGFAWAANGGVSPMTTYQLAGVNASQAFGSANTTTVFSLFLPVSVTTANVAYRTGGTADNNSGAGHNYSFGIFGPCVAGGTCNRVLHIAATAGSTLFPTTSTNKTIAWVEGSTTLAAGQYYVALTTDCASACATISNGQAFLNKAVAANASSATTGGALNTSFTAPADSWINGGMITLTLY